MSNQRRVRKVINRKQHDQKVLEFVDLVTLRLNELGAEISSLSEVMEEWTTRIEILEAQIAEMKYPLGALPPINENDPLEERTCEGIEGENLTMEGE